MVQVMRLLSDVASFQALDPGNEKSETRMNDFWVPTFVAPCLSEGQFDSQLAFLDELEGFEERGYESDEANPEFGA